MKHLNYGLKLCEGEYYDCHVLSGQLSGCDWMIDTRLIDMWFRAVPVQSPVERKWQTIFQPRWRDGEPLFELTERQINHSILEDARCLDYSALRSGRWKAAPTHFIIYYMYLNMKHLIIIYYMYLNMKHLIIIYYMYR